MGSTVTSEVEMRRELMRLVAGAAALKSMRLKRRRLTVPSRRVQAVLIRWNVNSLSLVTNGSDGGLFLLLDISILLRLTL